MKHSTLFLPLLLTLSCDEVPAEECPNTQDLTLVSPLPEKEITSRKESDPEAWYLSKLDGQKISSEVFAKAVMSCEKTEAPSWYLTLSGYLPDETVTDKRVVGLGGSAMTSSKWWNCMLEQFLKQGAIKL